MRHRLRPALRRLSAGGLTVALLVGIGACAGAAGAAPSADSASAPLAVRFDAVFQRLVGPTSLDEDAQSAAADLQQLHALLPPGDALREARLRALSCINQPWPDLQQALDYAAETAQRAHAAGDPAARARALICGAYFLTASNRSGAALTELDAVVALLQSLPAQQQLLAEALTARGGILSNLGEQARALQDFERARAAFRAAGLTTEFVPLLLRMASAYARIGDWAQAERELLRLVERTQSSRVWDGLVIALVRLGDLYNDSDAAAKAGPVLARAIALATEHGNSFGLAAARMGLARTHIARGQGDAALGELVQARAGFEANDDATHTNVLLLLTGQALAAKGQHVQALARYREALPLIRQDGNQLRLATLYEAQARSEEALGRSGRALADYKRYTALQMDLQRKMRLEQVRLLEHEAQTRQREAENQQLRAQADARRQQVSSLESVRRWQSLALVLGGLLLLLASSLAWRQWRQSQALRELAMTDTLTGVRNRRAIEAGADQALLGATPLALMVLDLDHFKAVNDRFGHAAGDAVLQAVARQWQAQLRDADRLGRVGGEEFVVVCPHTTLEQAHLVAQRLLEATRALRLPDIDPTLHVTTSIGLAQAQPGETRAALFARADAALYRAKQGGRDRMEQAADPSDSPAPGRTAADGMPPAR